MKPSLPVRAALPGLIPCVQLSFTVVTVTATPQDVTITWYFSIMPPSAACGFSIHSCYGVITPCSRCFPGFNPKGVQLSLTTVTLAAIPPNDAIILSFAANVPQAATHGFSLYSCCEIITPGSRYVS